MRMILNFPMEMSASSAGEVTSASGRERLFCMGETPRGSGDRERWSWALLIAALAHVGVAAAAMGLPAEAKPEPKPPEPELVFMQLAPPPAPAAHSGPVRTERPKSRARTPTPRPLVPRIIQERPLEQHVEKPVEPEPSVAETSEEPAGDVSPEAAGLGDSVAGVLGGVLGGLEGGLVGSTGGALELKQVATPPRVLEQVRPQYPRAARSDGIEGLVLVRVIIGVDGRIEPGSVQVVRSVPALDAAAMSAVSQWRFSPALGHQGRSVRVIVEIPVQFSLK